MLKKSVLFEEQFTCARNYGSILLSLSDEDGGVGMAARKSQEEKLRLVDEKIAYHEKHMVRLKVEREQLLAPPERKPRVRKPSMKSAVDALKDAGLSPEEILAFVAKTKKTKGKAEQE